MLLSPLNYAESDLFFQFSRLPHDLFVHVSGGVASAHGYIRSVEARSPDIFSDVSREILEEVGQVVKKHSGAKKATKVQIIFSRARNLRKTSRMNAGSVGFHKEREIKTIRLYHNDEVLSRLMKSRKRIKTHQLNLRRNRLELSEFGEEMYQEYLQEHDESRVPISSSDLLTGIVPERGVPSLAKKQKVVETQKEVVKVLNGKALLKPVKASLRLSLRYGGGRSIRRLRSSWLIIGLICVVASNWRE